MGVTYKLKDEVVQFIISQRQGNPLFSCRQLAESASQEFGLHLSKSSVHDVLKESGIITPRGRKPKDKFSIPQEKKKQIQTSLSQVKLLTMSVGPSTQQQDPVILSEAKDLKVSKDPLPSGLRMTEEKKQDMETSPEYDGAGGIFVKAALWDLGIFSEENIKEADWEYFLTYCKGVKVALENNKNFFIDLPLPIERCIREVADGLVNNVKPFIAHKVSDEGLFKACMDGQEGFKIIKMSIVGQNDHIILELDSLVEFKRSFMLNNRTFVENKEKNIMERSKAIFFPQVSGSNSVIVNMLNLKGFDSSNRHEINVSLLIGDSYDNKTILQEAVERLNGMYLRDEQDRLVKVKIQEASI